MDFIWNKKTSRLRRQVLQRPKISGGMGLPNFRYQYWATNIRNLNYWVTYGDSEGPPLWLKLDANSVLPVSLNALLHTPLPSSIFRYTNNVVVAASIKICNQFRRHFGLQTLSVGAPLAANPVFPPSLLDNTFCLWARLAIKTLRDLYVDSLFASCQQLVNTFSLPKRHFFRYLQVRSFVRNSFPQFPALPTPSDSEIFLKRLPSLNGGISSIYLNICNLCKALVSVT